MADSKCKPGSIKDLSGKQDVLGSEKLSQTCEVMSQDSGGNWKGLSLA